jgi:hypothetical protein
MSAPIPVPTEIRQAVVSNIDSKVVNIISWDGSFGWEPPKETTVVELLPAEECSLNWTYDAFGSPRFQLVGPSYEETIIDTTFIFGGSVAIGVNSPYKGYSLIFPDGTTQDTAVNRTRLTTFTALQEFAAGISSGQIITVDPVDGIGLIAAKALNGGNSRIGAVRLGYAGDSDYNTVLENSSGTFTIYNGISVTGSNLLNINTTRLQVNVPVDGFNFRSGITAPNIVYSINGCTGYIGITGTENEVTVTGPCPNIVIGLPDDVIISGSLTVNGGIYIDGGTF